MPELEIPYVRHIRVIVCSDAANEADDAFAVAHALLTPSFDVRGLVAGHFGTPGSMLRSRAELEALADSMGIAGSVRIASGAESALGSPVSSQVSGVPDGVALIVDEALRDDERPLYLLCMGALTDVALALRDCPEVAERACVVWVGGGRWPAGSHEANLARDLVAAREVLASDIALWQLPSGCYKRLTVPISELRLRLARCGRLGEHLWGQLARFAESSLETKRWVQPESWVLGDQAAVGALLAEQHGCYELRPAPGVTDDYRYTEEPGRRAIRVYHDLDVRLVLEDMFCKFELHA